MDDVRERENKRRLGEPELDSVEVNETNPGRIAAYFRADPRLVLRHSGVNAGELV